MKKILLTVGIGLFLTGTISNAQQIANGDFENGTYTSTAGTADPVGWGTYNFDGFGFTPTTTLVTTSPFSGATNAKLETLAQPYSTINSALPDTMAGALLPSDPFSGSPVNKPFSDTLQSMMFSFKTNLVNNDTAVVVAQTTSWDGSNSNVVQQAATLIGDNLSTWTTVNLPFSSASGTPDSILYIAMSSYGAWPLEFGPKDPEPGSVLELDAFIFCKQFKIDFSTAMTDSIVDFTAMTQATGNGGNGNLVWDFGDGSATSTAINPTHAYDGNGTYTISLTVTDSCGNDSTFTKDIDVSYSTASIGDVTKEDIHVSVYPNPAKDLVTVQVNGTHDDDVFITISDLTGRKVSEIYATTTANKQVGIRTGHLEAGNYLVEVTTRGGLKTTKKLMIIK